MEYQNEANEYGAKARKEIDALMREDDERRAEKETPQPVAKCPKCGADWFTTGAGFCGSCGAR
jgi:hypothetical protein